MDESTFNSNADFKGLIQSYLSGSISALDMNTTAQNQFFGSRFKCSDLESTARDEDSYVSDYIGEYPTLLDNEELLSKWFEKTGRLSEGAIFMLRELASRSTAYKDYNIKHFASKGIDYAKAIQELLEIGLIQEPANDKKSHPLCNIALSGMEFQKWQDDLIHIYLQTLACYNQSKNRLSELLENIKKGIFIEIKINVPTSTGYPSSCEKYRDKKYSKDNLSSLPEIPMTWGCKCGYIGITEFYVPMK